MKKYTALASIVVLIVGILSILPDVVMSFLPGVYVTQMKEVHFSNTISATGSIISKSKLVMTADMPVVASAVYFSEGDEIQKGDVIAKVSKEKTVSALADLSSELNSVSGAGGLISKFVGGSYDQSVIADNIPDEIVSDVTGIITSLDIQEGELLKNGDSILSVSENEDLMVVVSVNETNIADVEVGQNVFISGSGFRGTIYTGTVKRIAAAAKKQNSSLNQTTVVDVTIRFDHPDEKLKLGFSVTADIVTKQGDTIMALPYESIMQDNAGQEYVYVLSGGKLERKDIVIGVEGENGVEIIEGVSLTDNVVYDASTIEEPVEYVNVIGRVG